jgi:hypothetical protein
MSPERKKRVTALVSPEEHEIITAAAHAEGVSTSEFLRRCALGGAVYAFVSDDGGLHLQGDRLLMTAPYLGRRRRVKHE